MAFFGNKRKDFSIQPPRQQVDGTPFFVTDSANIDFTLLNLNLTANLTQLLPTSGTYGDSTHIPILQIDQFGRITGVTTVAIGGGGGTYTVDNGLTESPANNFQLGGALIKNTTITNASLYNLSITGSLSGSSLFNVNNSVVTFFEDVTTQAIKGQAQSGVGVFGDSLDNYGVYGNSKNSVGVRGVSTNNYAISGSGNYTTSGYFRVDNSSAGVLDVIKIVRVSTTSFDGVGFSLESNVTGGTTQVSNRLQSIFTDVNLATRTSQLQITSLNNAIESTTFTLKGTGQLQLNKYTAGFSGTAAYALGVDASGNVITITASPVSGDSISPFLLMGG